MNTTRSRHLRLFAQLFTILAAVMAVTRFHHFGSHLSLPDASWAVFFLAGFYLRGQGRWAFPLLMLEAVAIDYCAIRYFGVSNYCVTAAYGFILPGYAALWAGGAWFRQHCSFSLRGAGLLATSLLLSSSACDLITGGSFYWLGGRYTDPTLRGWMHHFTTLYPLFMLVPFAYVGLAATTHLLALQLRRAQPSTTGHSSA